MQEEREKYSPAIVRMCFRFTIFAKTSANSGQGNQIESAEYKQGDAEHAQGQAKARARKYGTVLRPASTNHTHPKGQNPGPPMQQGVLSIKVSRETLKQKISLKQALRENDKRRE